MDMYLQSIDVLSTVLKEAIVRIEHFMRKKIQPFSCNSTVIKTLLTLELDHESLSHVLWSHFDNLSVAILEHFTSAHLQSTVT